MPNFPDFQAAFDDVSGLVDDLSGGNLGRFDMTAIVLHLLSLEEDGTYTTVDDLGPVLEAMLYYPCTEYRAEITCKGDHSGYIDVYGWNAEYVEKLEFSSSRVDLFDTVKKRLKKAGYAMEGRHPHGGLKLIPRKP
ncbi:hypothetical protein P4N68_10335 [Corynebacterium felinum]|uniref:Uncharacterized protein n=1 Tax=Corynebacterium felinum TaxID=131318 RepID=A0ABU2BBB9_9CORY|nr:MULTISPECIES: hypothetical protein [Corynebacterium]MDF5821469.1 hypothetical protein [Corynebacterium felinum]MDO4762103.1 hypothetical protein [Corynebacterium sp.]MDR7354664.1 hypothetical protein [Corynebacterium felinum]WJY94028.1 hypothetical protein CFELI_01925 [Corynebacterium felinum]